MAYSIPEIRELTQREKLLLSILFEAEKPVWMKWIDKIKVIARCGCGKCPTILFGETFESEVLKGELIIDYFGLGANGEYIGVSLFGTMQLPTELEFYSLDGEIDIIDFPIIGSLRPMAKRRM